jgi:hypothetical protein
MMMKTHTPTVSNGGLPEKITPYHFTPQTTINLHQAIQSAGLADALNAQDFALAERIEDFVDSFLASPLANMLLAMEPNVANTPSTANTVSEQWLAVVMGPTLPHTLPSTNQLPLKPSS